MKKFAPYISAEEGLLITVSVWGAGSCSNESNGALNIYAMNKILSAKRCAALHTLMSAHIDCSTE